MLRPFILIGVGGSGGKTLRVIRQTLRTRLTEARWPANKDLPAAWQFLQIDVATVADGDDPDLPPQLPPGQFLGMVGPGVTYGTLDTALGGALAPIDQLESLGGWKPDPEFAMVPAAAFTAPPYGPAGLVTSFGITVQPPWGEQIPLRGTPPANVPCWKLKKLFPLRTVVAFPLSKNAQ